MLWYKPDLHKEKTSSIKLRATRHYPFSSELRQRLSSPLLPQLGSQLLQQEGEEEVGEIATLQSVTVNS